MKPEDNGKWLKAISCAVKDAIITHGDVTIENRSSAVKRIFGHIKGSYQ